MNIQFYYKDNISFLPTRNINTYLSLIKSNDIAISYENYTDEVLSGYSSDRHQMKKIYKSDSDALTYLFTQSSSDYGDFVGEDFYLFQPLKNSFKNASILSFSINAQIGQTSARMVPFKNSCNEPEKHFDIIHEGSVYNIFEVYHFWSFAMRNGNNAGFERTFKGFLNTHQDFSRFRKIG